MIKVYGIPNCDTVKKARAWLAEQGVAHEFHDFKKQGVPEDRLDAWLAAVGWERLLNRRGPTWRKLDPALQTGVVDGTSAKPVMVALPLNCCRKPSAFILIAPLNCVGRCAPLSRWRWKLRRP